MIKARYEILSKNIAETNEAFERLALKRVKEKKKRKKMIQHNYKLWKIAEYLKVKIKMLTTKATTRSVLQVLLEAPENLQEDHPR